MADPRGIVFLDRDGTLNVEVDRLSLADQVELIPGAGEAVGRLNRAGYVAVVVTNQSVIARGECSEDGLAEIHERLRSLLREAGGHVDAVYYCPHHPDPDSVARRPEFVIACDCRKPGRGMIERGLLEFARRREACWLIGDTTVDLKTAENAGIRSILVETGYAGRDGRYPVEPDHVFSDLSDAVDFLLADEK